MSASQKIAELESIIHDYTVIFLIFDALFFVLLLGGVILAIKFIKEKGTFTPQTNTSHTRFMVRKKSVPESRANFMTPWLRTCVTARAFPKRKMRLTFFPKFQPYLESPSCR